MRKADFLQDQDVQKFINWLAEKLNDRSITHDYSMPGGKVVHFDGLEGALDHYDWSFSFSSPNNGEFVRGKTYSDNDAALAILSVGLDSALNASPSFLQDMQIRDWSIAVMEWGGVRNGNVTWLQANVVGLATEISNVKHILSDGDDDKIILGGTIRRFNAGMTKVYSLLVPDFVIYDSRVAAALAWFITYWCIENKRTHVPPLLRFPCMRPKEGGNPAIKKNRNPSRGEFQFPWMHGAVNHSHWNLRASWILSETLRVSKKRQEHGRFLDKSNPLRALEAALFMWGYDLGSKPPCKTQAALPFNALDEEYDILGGDENHSAFQATSHNSTTRGGKEKEFSWTFDSKLDSVKIERGLSKSDYFKIQEIFSVIHVLYDHFGDDWYPLANNVEKLGVGTERMGLGSAIFSMSNDITHSQAASQLGVILEAVGIFEWNNKSRGIAWRLRVEPPTTIDDLRMAFLGS